MNAEKNCYAHFEVACSIITDCVVQTMMQRGVFHSISILGAEYMAGSTAEIELALKEWLYSVLGGNTETHHAREPRGDVRRNQQESRRRGNYRLINLLCAPLVADNNKLPLLPLLQ
jgi:hypothetical protein